MKISCNLIVNPKKNVLEDYSMTISEGLIIDVEKNKKQSYDLILKDAIVFPGLINIHDHLKYSWHKRIGNEGNYTSVYFWLKDLYEEFDSIVDDNNIELLFQLGIYKQIFSATTTVLNHSRYPKTFFSQDLEYIDLFDEFERELVVQPGFLSSLTSHKSTFGPSIVESHTRAIKNKRPFMIHVAEGRTAETKNEIKVLGQHGILTEESILVHCINADDLDIELIKKGGCSVVWCPVSSEFVTGKVPPINKFLEVGINVCIGTDSSCSGGTDLFEEMRFAKKQYKKEFNKDIESSAIFDMVTANSAKALRNENIGVIKNDSVADIAIVDKRTNNPYDDILNSTAESIIALLHKGVFVYGDEDMMKYFPIYENTNYFYFSINGRKKVVIGNPNEIVLIARKKFELDKTIWFPFIPREVGKNEKS